MGCLQYSAAVAQGAERGRIAQKAAMGLLMSAIKRVDLPSSETLYTSFPCIHLSSEQLCYCVPHVTTELYGVIHIFEIQQLYNTGMTFCATHVSRRNYAHTNV